MSINLRHGIFCMAANDASIVATGGSISYYTDSGDVFKVHTFTDIGFSNFSSNRIIYDASVLIVGGGSSGIIAGEGYAAGSGGGGGTVKEISVDIPRGDSSIHVGSVDSGNMGCSLTNWDAHSSYPTIYAGVSSAFGTYSGAAGRPNQWVGGGNCNYAGGSGHYQYFGGGGGGNSEVGGDGGPVGPGTLYGGEGGEGTASSITGTSVVYGSGGGGNGYSGPAPAGGTGAGAGSYDYSGVGGNATTYGSGGGGGGFDINGGAAGSGMQGVVIIKYKYN